jgi:hypothetical protein
MMGGAMLFPENPEKRPSLWDSITTQLAKEAMCFLIQEGIGNPLAEAKEPARNVADLVLSRLRSAQICRISASGGRAVAPHFACKREGDTALVTELMTYPSEGGATVDNDKLKRDLETAAVNLLFAEGGVSTVIVPLHLVPWTMRDAEINLTAEGLVFRKKL